MGFSLICDERQITVSRNAFRNSSVSRTDMIFLWASLVALVGVAAFDSEGQGLDSQDALKLGSSPH